VTRLAAALAVAMTAAASAQGAPQLVVRDAYLMGTRASLATSAPTRDAGLSALGSALTILERTEAELSTWRDDSEMSRLNRHPIGAPWRATPATCRLLDDVWRWHAATGGAFDPAIGRLLGAWDVHGDGAVPDASEQARAAKAAGLAQLSFDSTDCTLIRSADVTIDVGAFGKGEALDRAAAVMGDDAWMFDLGGQVSAGGAPGDGWPVAIAHPRDRDTPHMQIHLRHGSLSTSGGSERDQMVSGTRVGHIFDPRTGRPATFAGSVTVWHERALAADILSTALYVMGPEDGMRWARANGIAAMYLIPERAAVQTLMTAAFGAAPAMTVSGLE
jgi:thiamine biosynthesis lipoprotein